MANSLLTTSKITRAAVVLFKNANMFIRSVDRQYDSEFGRDGEKIGSQLRVRLPNDYTVTKGPAASIQDTAETQVVLTLATQAHVDVSFTTQDLYLAIEDFSERILEPMMNNLAGQVAVDVMNLVETGNIPGIATSTGGSCNLVANWAGTAGASAINAPTAATVLQANAVLADNSAPMMPQRKVVLSPWTEASLVSTLSGLFNPQTRIGEQYITGQMKNALGFDFFMDQTVVTHTTGSFSAGTVNGANQTGNTIVTNAITGTLNVGDIITFAGVYAVNRVNKQNTNKLRQFVVTAAAASGATSISVYPAVIPPSSVTGNAVQYQTVSASPANSAAISLVGLPSVSFRKNLAYSPKAITMVTGDLPLPRMSAKASRATYDGISMRMVEQYAIGTDQEISRIDVLYGALATRPEWTCVIADAP